MGENLNLAPRSFAEKKKDLSSHIPQLVKCGHLGGPAGQPISHGSLVQRHLVASTSLWWE